LVYNKNPISSLLQMGQGENLLLECNILQKFK
jgi:hypothetical protein